MTDRRYLLLTVAVVGTAPNGRQNGELVEWLQGPAACSSGFLMFVKRASPLRTSCTTK